jgi:hypothetical protein
MTPTSVPTKSPVQNCRAYYAGSNLELKGNIAVNLYLNLSAVPENGAYATVRVGEKETRCLLSEIAAEENGKYRLYTFRTPVKAKETNEQITVRLFHQDGSAIEICDRKGTKKYENGYNYSVAAIADTYYSSDVYSREVRELARAIRNYGICAQKMMNYKADGLVCDDDYADITVASLRSYAAAKSGSVSGVHYQGPSLGLQSNTILSNYFGLSEELSRYTFRVDGEITEPTDFGDYCGIDISDIAAQDLDKRCEITVTDGSRTMKVETCALSWAYSVLSRASYFSGETVMMAKALYRYNQCADAYFRTLE